MKLHLKELEKARERRARLGGEIPERLCAPVSRMKGNDIPSLATSPVDQLS
jgi:hypothetical protein